MDIIESQISFLEREIEGLIEGGFYPMPSPEEDKDIWLKQRDLAELRVLNELYNSAEEMKLYLENASYSAEKIRKEIYVLFENKMRKRAYSENKLKRLFSELDNNLESILYFKEIMDKYEIEG